MKIAEIVVKITSICNLSCSYCHVFNKGNDIYKREPAVMSLATAKMLLYRIEEYCETYSVKKMHIIFHGGEPLLAGKQFFEDFIAIANELVTSAQLIYSLQTNGTLLTKEWCALFRRLNIQIGISIDGDRLSSKNRIFRGSKEEAFDDIIRGYNTLV